MSAYLLDTNHAAELLKSPQAAIWDRMQLLGQQDCLLCMPVVAELWFMVFNSQRVEQNTLRLVRFMTQFIVADFDASAAVEYGRIRAELRNLGRPIPTIDAIIASIARSRGLTIASSDVHFMSVPGLAVVDWLKGP